MVDVVLDASHGGSDYGAVGVNGVREKDCTLYIAKVCKGILESSGVSVKLTRDSDIGLMGEERTSIANNEGAKCFVTIHANSSDDRRETGVEVISATDDVDSSKLAYDLITSLSNCSKLNSRGAKYSDLILFKENNMPSAMVKVCFITNEREENLLASDSFNNEVAGFIADGIREYLEVNNKAAFLKDDVSSDQLMGALDRNMDVQVVEKKAKENVETLTPILGGEIPDKNQAKQWAKNKGATDNFIALVDLYWALYKESGNVNPAVAYAQAAIETQKGNFNLDIKEDMFNPGGLKEDKSENYKKFDSWKDGVKAHLDHLALYAGAVGYPNRDSKDPRHFSYLFGICKYVENLSGKWSSEINYGIDILGIFYEILGTQSKDIFKESIESIDGLKIQIGDFKNKVVLMGRTLEEVCKEYNQIYKSLETLKDEIVTLEKDKIDLEAKNQLLSKNVVEQKKVLRDIVKIIGGSVEKK